MSNQPSEAQVVATLRDLQLAVQSVRARDVDRAEAMRHLEAAQALLSAGEPRERSRTGSTFSGALNPIAPPMEITTGALGDGRPALIGRVRLDQLREGPPRSVHGGVLAGMFDELMGGAPRLNGGDAGMTGRLTVRYRRPTPLGEDLVLRAWIHDERKRRVTVRADCHIGGEGAVDPLRHDLTAEAEAFFLRVDFARLDEIMSDRATGETPPPAPGKVAQ